MELSVDLRLVTSRKLSCPRLREGYSMLGTVLLVILVLLLLGVIPTWGHSSNWGYGPSGIVGTVLIIVLILLLLGKI